MWGHNEIISIFGRTIGLTGLWLLLAAAGGSIALARDSGPETGTLRVYVGTYTGGTATRRARESICWTWI